MSLEYYIQVILTILVFSAVLMGVLKFSGSLHKKKYKGEIKVVDRLPVANNIALVIVDIRGDEYLLSVGGSNAKILEKLSK